MHTPVKIVTGHKNQHDHVLATIGQLCQTSEYEEIGWWFLILLGSGE
jgi:hypothetical protein